MAEETEVDKIKIIDRLDNHPTRFERVEVSVWDDKDKSVSCGIQSYKGSTTYTFNCPANARGNHIFIKKYGTTTNWFHINNVEVYKRTPETAGNRHTTQTYKHTNILLPFYGVMKKFVTSTITIIDYAMHMGLELSREF